MNSNWDYYKIFYFVGKHGSFTQAARFLHNNQPNITRVINTLESELGCRLFVRSKKGVTLTPEGAKLFSHIESAYHHIEKGEDEITSDRLLENGSVSVSISEIALHVLMLPILQRFKAKHLGIRIRVFNHSTPQGVNALEQGLVDLAVISSPLKVSDSLEATHVKSFQEIIIGGEPYISLSTRKHTLQEISSYPLVTQSHDSTSFQYLTELFLKDDIILKPSIEVTTTDQILPIVEHGMGLGFVPKELAMPSIERKKIFPIPLVDELPSRSISLLQDKSRPLSLAKSRPLSLAALELKRETLQEDQGLPK